MLKLLFLPLTLAFTLLGVVLRIGFGLLFFAVANIIPLAVIGVIVFVLIQMGN